MFKSCSLFCPPQTCSYYFFFSRKYYHDVSRVIQTRNPRIILEFFSTFMSQIEPISRVFYVLLTPLNTSWLYLYLPLHVNCLCLNFCPPLIKTFKIHIIYYGLRAPCLILPFYFYNFTFFYYFLLSLPFRHKALLFVSWIPDLISILEPLHLAVHSAWRTNSFPRPFTQRYIQLLSIILLC